MKKKLVSTGVSLLNSALVIAAIFLPAIVIAQETSQNVGARLTSGRLASLAILAVGIISLVIGYRSNKLSANASPANNGKKGAVIAFILGSGCIILSAIRVVNTSGFGTGGGKAGSIVALLVGGIAVVLAMMSLYRNQTIKSN